MKQRNTTSRRRDGFTLIELLVVIAIILILIGMLLVAIFPTIGSQKGRMTKAALKKLDGEIRYQWGEASKEFSKKSLPPGGVIQSVFGCDDQVAKVIWLKLQLKAAFPMNYAEALDPAGGNTALQTVLKPRPKFVNAIKKASNNPLSESAACLYLALQQNFGGKKFDAEASLGPSAIKDTDSDGLMEIVDPWGNPVFFFRWGAGNADLDALAPAGAGVLDRDTEDSEHRLMDAIWNPDGSLTNGVKEFQRLCHSLRGSSGRRSYFTVPTVVSSGKDEQIGLNLDMSSAGPAEADNYYSFKVR